MWTNGTPNHIHIFQAMADQLTTAGKKHWLSMQAELIEAKGKGEMQTCWVEPGCGNSSSRCGTDSLQSDDWDMEEGVEEECWNESGKAKDVAIREEGASSDRLCSVKQKLQEQEKRVTEMISSYRAQHHSKLSPRIRHLNFR